jgi:O-antigen ligase
VKKNNRDIKRNSDVSLNNLIYVCCVVISFLYLSKMAEPSLGSRWIMLNLLAVIFPLIIIFKLYFGKDKKEIKLSRIHILVIFLAIWLAVSGLWAINKANYIQEFINHLSIIMLILIFSFKTNQLDLTKLFRLLSIIALGLSLLGILQYYGLVSKLFPQAAPPASTFVNKNLATSTIILLFPITYVQILWLKNSRIWKLIHSISCTFTLAYIIAAATRSAWLGIIISIIFILITILIKSDFKKNLSSKNIIYLFASIVVALLLVFCRDLIVKENNTGKSLNDQIETISTLSESISIHNSTNSINMRLIKWRNALEMFKAKPFIGFGLGNFDANYPLFHKSAFEDRNYDTRLFIAELHNEPLQYLVELGLIGILLLLIFIGYLYFILIRLLKTDFFSYALIILAGITALLIDSLFNHSFHFPTAMFFFSLYSGIAISKYNQVFPKNLFTIRSTKILLPIMITFLILSGLVFNTSNRKYKSNVLYRKALSYDRAERTKQAVQFITRSVDSWPYWNISQYHCSRISARNYLLKKTKKSYKLARKYNDIALKNMPYNFLLNSMRFKLILAGGTGNDLKSLKKNVPLLKKIMPYGSIYDVYDLLQNYYEKMNDPAQALEYEYKKNKHAGDSYFEYGKYEKSLKYYEMLKEKSDLSAEIEERIEFLESVTREDSVSNRN